MPFLYSIDKPTKIDLRDLSTIEVDHISKDEASAKVEDLGAELNVLQEALYAASTHSVLIVLQAMDTGGKDGTISHVFKYINPQACSVTSFKEPTPLQLAHDFLWRAHQSVPPNGIIQIFNRSHYEDVLVVRVHELVPESVWKDRYAEIQHFEALLAKNNTIILKFYLHISKDEQKKRLLAREEDPDKSWKLSTNDWKERQFWDKYMPAYQDAIGKTAADHAPWYVVPSNNKWYRNYAVAEQIVTVLKQYRPEWQKTLEKIGDQRKAELKQMRSQYPQLADEALPITRK